MTMTVYTFVTLCYAYLFDYQLCNNCNNCNRKKIKRKNSKGQKKSGCVLHPAEIIVLQRLLKNIDY